MVKGLLKIVLIAPLYLAIIVSSLVFPLVKIAVCVFVCSYLGYMVFKYRNWTFGVPSVGGALNLVTILANGGRMPVKAPLGTILDPTHVLMNSGTHFKLLCDIFPLAHLGLFSVGDIVTTAIWFLTVAGYYGYRYYRKVKNGSHS